MQNKTVDWEKRSREFDTVAELYDAYRPDYPGELIESILSTTGIPPGGRILEIGSGTGKATAPFARRGFFDGVAQVINAHGGYVVKPYVTILYVAPKTGQ
jgi:hypothetical protein